MDQHAADTADHYTLYKYNHSSDKDSPHTHQGTLDSVLSGYIMFHINLLARGKKSFSPLPLKIIYVLPPHILSVILS